MFRGLALLLISLQGCGFFFPPDPFLGNAAGAGAVTPAISLALRYPERSPSSASSVDYLLSLTGLSYSSGDVSISYTHGASGATSLQSALPSGGSYLLSLGGLTGNGEIALSYTSGSQSASVTLTHYNVIDRMNRRSNGSESSGTGATSYPPAISSNGRYVAFYSEDTTMVAGDTNASGDIFLLDRFTGSVELISKNTAGVIGNGVSTEPCISGDGRYVGFTSSAFNLVAGDANALQDVFLRDRTGGTTIRASFDTGGGDPNGGNSSLCSLNFDGSLMVYKSGATDLIAADGNAVFDIFLYTRSSNSTSRVSTTSAGTETVSASDVPSISADGRYVVFQNPQNLLVAGDTNGTIDVFVKNLQTGVLSIASSSSSGVVGNGTSSFPRISSDGRYVVFHSSANNLIGSDSNGGVFDAYLKNTTSGETRVVSLDNAGVQTAANAQFPIISDDGRYVTFQTTSALVGDDDNALADVYARDLTDGHTEMLARSESGVADNTSAFANDYFGMTPDGRYVCFHSRGGNLISNDTNGVRDMFCRLNPTADP